MSQEKVDRYKEYKKNRKEELEKEKRQQKRNSMLGRVVACVLILGILVALGITVYNGIRARAESAPQYDRENLVVADVAGVFATTTAVAETEPEEATTAAAETTAAEQTTANDVETTTAAPETTAAP